MKKHNFGPIARNTNIALVTKEMIDNRALRTSSSEMLVLFNNFAFIVGDLIPAKRPEWKVYRKLREIMSIVQ